MEKLQKELDPRPAGGIDLLMSRFEIEVTGTLLDKMPPEAVAGRSHTDVQQPPVIGFSKLLMPRRGDQVEPPVSVVAMRRALKTAH
jgi:hypothetical protein